MDWGKRLLGAALFVFVAHSARAQSCITAPSNSNDTSCANTAWVRANSTTTIPVGLVLNSTADQSAVVQAALNACSAAGGGQLTFPTGVFYVQGLVRPNQCFLVGVAPKANTGATILRLPPNANNYILADQSYVLNATTATQGGGIQDLTLDGNSSNGTSATALYIMRAFNSTVFRANIINSPGHGLLETDLSANGSSLPATASLSDVFITYSNIKNNAGAAIRGVNGTNNRLADLRIMQNSLGNNGLSASFGTYCSIHLDRAAGMDISHNEEFGNPQCSMSIGNASQLRFIGNYIDASVAQAVSGTITSSLISANAGPGNINIVGNTFKNAAASLGGASGEILLSIVNNANNGASAGGFVVDGNSFESNTVAMTSLAVSGSGLPTIPIVMGVNSYSSNTPPLVWTVGGSPAPKIPNCGTQSDNLYYSVSDLTSTTIGSTAVGGGSNYGAVRCNGNTGHWQIVGN